MFSVSSLISFAGSNSTSASSSRFTAMGIDSGLPIVVGGRLFEGGDYFKYIRQRQAIIRGRRLIEGRLLFEEMQYLK